MIESLRINCSNSKGFEGRTNKSNNPPGRRYQLGFEEASQHGKRLCPEKFLVHGAFQDLWTHPLCKSPMAAYTAIVSSEPQNH